VWQSFPQLLWAKSKGKGKMKRTSRGKSREDEAAKNFASQTFLHKASTAHKLAKQTTRKVRNNNSNGHNETH